ncbi:glucose-1-phosphate adenylyltransferase [bacterium]
MDNTLAMVLAGGQGSRLNILAHHRAKPAVPFGGIYRIIDFTLSNIMNSNIGNIGVLTQYRPSSLIEHIQTGETWGFYGKNRSATVLPPYAGETALSWYEGTADAVYQNRAFIERFESVDKVLILSGDHIYNMDYAKLIEFHKKKRAHLTVVSMEVPIKEAHRYGTIITDDSDRIIDFDEKPKKPISNLVSMGVYLFNKQTLLTVLAEDARNPNSKRDFGKDILPSMVDRSKIYIYKFKDYWRDVGTLQSYWDTSMELLRENKGIDLESWQVRTNLNRNVIADRKPAYIAKSSTIKNSLISDGCLIKGKVENSIISPGVIIESGVEVKDSIIFHDSIVKKNAVIDRCIIDKNATISENVNLGKGKFPGKKNFQFPKHLSTGLTIVGKLTKIPREIQSGRNCVFYPGLTIGDFKKKIYQDGEVIGG